MMEEKTLIRISIDNNNNIRHEIDIESIDQEEPLRIIHSILDEMKIDLIDFINDLKIKEIEEDDEL